MLSTCDFSFNLRRYDKELVATAGIDALAFVRVCQFGIQLFVPIMFLAVLVGSSRIVYPCSPRHPPHRHQRGYATSQRCRPCLPVFGEGMAPEPLIRFTISQLDPIIRPLYHLLMNMPPHPMRLDDILEPGW